MRFAPFNRDSSSLRKLAILFRKVALLDAPLIDSLVEILTQLEILSSLRT